MANISTQIAAIEAAARGEEVRDSIVSAFNAINTLATSNSSGLMSASDKSFLNSIPDPSASDSGKFLRVNSSGDYVLATVSNAEGVNF